MIEALPLMGLAWETEHYTTGLPFCPAEARDGKRRAKRLWEGRLVQCPLSLLGYAICLIWALVVIKSFSSTIIYTTTISSPSLRAHSVSQVPTQGPPLTWLRQGKHNDLTYSSSMITWLASVPGGPAHTTMVPRDIHRLLRASIHLKTVALASVYMVDGLGVTRIADKRRLGTCLCIYRSSFSLSH
ncbi:uncharacterized protein UDID_18779 [Ustilago sp. UG-2017a]|nr:uncharacterized protein UDID_18779 [Ustilago sp. UG-2017a]